MWGSTEFTQQTIIFSQLFRGPHPEMTLAGLIKGRKGVERTDDREMR